MVLKLWKSGGDAVEVLYGLCRLRDGGGGGPRIVDCGWQLELGARLRPFSSTVRRCRATSSYYQCALVE